LTTPKYSLKYRLTQVVDESFYVLESRRVEHRATVARLPVVVDFERAQWVPVVNDFLSVFVNDVRVHVDFVPGPRGPNRVFHHVRVRYGFGHAQKVFDGPLVRFSRVAVLARAEPHGVLQLSVRTDHFSRETHFAWPWAVDVHEQRH